MSQIRRDFDLKTGRGFSLVNLKKYFPESLSQKLQEAEYGFRYDLRRQQEPRPRIYGLDIFKPFIKWTMDLLNESLPDGQTLYIQEHNPPMDLRTDLRSEFREPDKFHLDGAYITLLLQVHGPGTLYSPNDLSHLDELVKKSYDPKDGIEQVPQGYALIMSNPDRSDYIRTEKGAVQPPLIHARPTTTEGRLLLFVLFSANPKT